MFRIRTRLVAAFLVVALLPAGPLYLVVNNLLDRSLNPALHAELTAGLESGLVVSREDLARRKADLVQAAAQASAGTPLYLDEFGQPLAAPDRPAFPSLDLPDPGAPPVRLGDYLVLVPADAAGADLAVARLPAALVAGAGDITQAIALLRAMELERDQVLRSYVLPFLVVYGLLLGLAMGVALLVARRLARPLEALSAGAQRVADGDLETRIPAAGRGEIGGLVTAFNHMVERLGDQRQALARLEKLAAWRGLSRVLAHEIKNPLTPIQLAVQEARQSFERGNPEHGQVLADCESIVLEEVAGLRKMVAGFSDFARMPQPNPVPDDFRPLAEDLGRLYGSRLVCDLPDGDLPVLMDAAELRRALINLIDNGLNAMAHMAAAPSVQLTVEALPDRCLIHIRDEGVGISAENRARIFEPDFSTGQEGMGLGLPVVDGIVKGHGGTLDFTSEQGQGTTFTVVLPRPTAD